MWNLDAVLDVNILVQDLLAWFTRTLITLSGGF